MKIDAKDLAKYIAKRLIRFLLALVVVIWLIGFCVSTGRCQSESLDLPEPKHIDLHTDQDEWEESIGIKFVTVTNKDDRLVYYYVTRKWEQKLSSIGWDERTIFQAQKDKKKKMYLEGCFLMIYCKKHLMAYVLEQIPCRPEVK